MWVDASNYTGPFSDEQIDDLINAGVVGVIVQAITGLDGYSYTRQQLQKCVDRGLKVAGYVWCFPGSSVASRLPMFDGFPLESLWLDVEQSGLSVLNVNRDLILCDAVIGAWQTGIYSGKWFFDQQGWSNLGLWAYRPLWDSNYDGIATVDADFRPYGGWDHCVIKQYRGTSDIGRVHQIDLDIA